MQLIEFAGMQFLSAAKAHEICEGIGRTRGQKVIGTWCAVTGFVVRVLAEDGVPQRWWIHGPMTRDEAREELTGKVDIGSVH